MLIKLRKSLKIKKKSVNRGPADCIINPDNNGTLNDGINFFFLTTNLSFVSVNVSIKINRKRKFYYITYNAYSSPKIQNLIPFIKTYTKYTKLYTKDFRSLCFIN